MGKKHGAWTILQAILAAVLMTAAFALSGCVSLSNFQTAETTKKGEFDLGVGITGTSVSPTTEAEADEVYEDVTYLLTEFVARYGVADKFDVGAKIYGVSPFFGMTFDVKYQFMDGEKLTSAVDVGFGMAGIEVEETDTTFFDYFGSLLFTYQLSDTASVTLSPKIITRDINSEVVDVTETIGGGTLTLQLGKEGGMRIYPEVGYYLGDEADFMHYGIGFKW